MRKKKPNIHRKIDSVRLAATPGSTPSEKLKSITDVSLAPSFLPNRFNKRSPTHMKTTMLPMTSGKRALLSGHFIAEMITQMAIAIKAILISAFSIFIILSPLVSLTFFPGKREIVPAQ